MLVKFVVDEDFVNYKKACMFIGFPYCSMKCGRNNCQNAALLDEPDIDISYDEIVNRYMDNKITNSIVFGGLEPFDSWQDLHNLIMTFRLKTDDDIVIYSGYTEEELRAKIDWLSIYDNIYIKFGRYYKKSKPRMDDVLGVQLASDNQYCKKISF